MSRARAAKLRNVADFVSAETNSFIAMFLSCDPLNAALHLVWPLPKLQILPLKVQISYTLRTTVELCTLHGQGSFENHRRCLTVKGVQLFGRLPAAIN